MRQLEIGGVLIDKFGDGPDIEFGLRRLLPTASEEILDELIAVYGDRHVNAAKRTLRLAMHSFLIRTSSHVIVVDTCLGNDKERPTRPHFHHRKTPFLENLRALGVSPEEVDFVMCTHMHSDHTGWNTRLENGRWVPTFPNARYVMARKEYEHWLECSRTQPASELLHGSFADSVLPVVESGQAMMVDESDHICDHIRIEYFVGHSPGNVAIFVDGERGQAVCTGDIIHSPVQFRYPDLLTSCDDPEQARRSRLRLYERVVDTSTILLPAHFQDPTAGYLRSEGTRLRYEYID
jgi:glyoxylase-like metal-dependent hydrolase (beta-lactamase superfamily II)